MKQSILVVILTLALIAPLKVEASGTLVKSPSFSAVYYLGDDGKRYVFPSEGVYRSWYQDFAGVVTISDAELFSLPIGGNVTYKPGAKMVKITTDPKVYAVDNGGTLRWIVGEEVASALYGADWSKNVHDIPDAFFVNYKVGSPITSPSDFAPNVATISEDKSLGSITPQPIVPTPVVIQPAETRPSIRIFTADKSIIRAGETIKFSWDVDNAVVCAWTRDKNSIQIPFVGRLPSAEATTTIDREEYIASPDFTFYLVCADKDWNTVTGSYTLTKDRTAIVFSIEPRIDVFASGSYYHDAQLVYEANKELTVKITGEMSSLMPATKYSAAVVFEDEAGNIVQRTINYTTPDISFPYAIRAWQDPWYDRHGVDQAIRCYTDGPLCTSLQWATALGTL